MRVDDVVPDRHIMKYDFMNQDPLEEFMFKSLYKENLDREKLTASAELIEIVLNLSECNEEDVRSSEVTVQEVEKSSEGLILKELPMNFKYAFLGEEKSKLVRRSEVTVQEAEKSFEGLILKELPMHLKYAFLGEEKSKPMIIESNLTSKKEKEVVETLRKYKEVIAWSIEDLKGINPPICMHKILMKENAKSFI